MRAVGKVTWHFIELETEVVVVCLIRLRRFGWWLLSCRWGVLGTDVARIRLSQQRCLGLGKAASSPKIW